MTRNDGDGEIQPDVVIEEREILQEYDSHRGLFDRDAAIFVRYSSLFAREGNLQNVALENIKQILDASVIFIMLR